MKTKFKVLIASVALGGTIDSQRRVQVKAAADLENQINAAGVANVLTVSAHQADHDFQLIAVVEVPLEPAQGE